MLDKVEKIKFEKWCDKLGIEYLVSPSIMDLLESAWRAALQPEIVSDPYEKLINPLHMPFINWESRPWATEVRIGYCRADTPPDRIGDRIMTIKRPIPEWEPKNGEPVLFNRDGVAYVGIWCDGLIYFGGLCYISEVKILPFNPDNDKSKIGKPWDEI